MNRGDKELIRLAEERDAQAVNDIRKGIILSIHTTKFFISSPQEIPSDFEKEKEKILKSIQDGNLYIVFEVLDEAVGFLVFNRYKLNRLKHTGSIGMGIKEEFASQGIGKKMMEYLFAWAAEQKGLEKLCLGVVSGNERAINLYNRMGFIEEGRQRNQIKYEDGTYGDDIAMAYFLK